MDYIFVSYSRKDTLAIDQLVDALEATGYSVRIDRDPKVIPGGSLWKRQIVEAIEGARVFLLALSPQSVKSEQVRKELDIADKKGIAILPVEIQKTSLTTDIELPLAGRQLIDLGTDWDDGVKRVLQALRIAWKVTAKNQRRIDQEGYKKLNAILANPVLSMSKKVELFQRKYQEEADKTHKPFLDKLDQLRKRKEKLGEEIRKVSDCLSDLESDWEQLIENKQTPKRILELAESELKRVRQKYNLLSEELIELSHEEVKTLEALMQLGKEENKLTRSYIENANREIEKLFKK